MKVDRARFGRLFRFGMVGVSGMFVNQGMLMLLHGGVGLPLLIASILAIETSILTNFYLNTRWTWKANLQGSLRIWVKKAAQYHAAAVLSAFAGNVLILLGLVHFFDVDYRLANLVGIAFGSILNFAAGELWIFRRFRSSRT